MTFPNRTRFLRLLLVSMVAVAFLLPGCASKTAQPTLSPEQRDLNLESFDAVWTTVRDRHFDPELGGLDWPAVRHELRPKVRNAADMGEVRGILSGMLARLGQSHFGIIPSSAMTAMSDLYGEGGGEGVPGMVVRVIEGRALVTAVWEEYPAMESGVRPGWEIVAIRGDEVAPLLEEIAGEFQGKTTMDYILASVVIERLTGPVDENLAVRFLDGEDRPVDLEIPLAKARGKKFKLGVMPEMFVWSETRRLDGDIGYFTFSNFMHPVAVMPAFNQAMGSFLDAKGVIIDLRGNTGGMLPMGMGMAGWFVEEEDRYLGTMYLRDNELKAIIVPRPKIYKGPVAILIDGLSASMSEIFAGGLKDLGRARIFGTTTAGAALPSQMEKLPNGDGFQFAMANYISTGGDVLEGTGVIPDEEIRPTRDQLLAGRDPVLEAAVAWILSLQ